MLPDPWFSVTLLCLLKFLLFLKSWFFVFPIVFSVFPPPSLFLAFFLYYVNLYYS